jgi:1-acyl-sn-glycerol-3-phosphate acyltransferase
MSSLKKMLRLMQEGHRVLVFPEGARSEDGEVGEAQPGVGLLIAKSRAPILPIRLYGAYDALPRGAKRLRSTPVRLVVGDVLDLDEDRARARSKEDYRKLAALKGVLLGYILEKFMLVIFVVIDSPC